MLRVIIFFLLSSSTLLSQGTRFYATTDAALLDSKNKIYQVITGSSFQVSFTMENGNGSQFRGPDFSGLKVLGGPGTSSQISIVNGRKSEKRSYIYDIVGTTEGTYTIRPAEIRSGGKNFRTQPFTVKVIKGSKQPGVAGSGKSYVKTVLSDTSVYIGQQITLKINLYTQENIKQYDLLKNDLEFDGFYAEAINDFSRRTTKEIINGEEFYVVTLNVIGLFPQQTGTYNIPALDIRLGIPDATNRRNIFAFQEYKYKIVSTDPINIDVSALPDPKPESFSGAVGSYSAAYKIDKRNVKTDETVIVTLETRGDGDNKKITAPTLSLSDDFEVYDPNSVRDELYRDQGKVKGYKTFEYLVVPKTKGRKKISPAFSYFNIDSNDYVTIHGGPYTLNVTQGTVVNNDIGKIIDRNLSPMQPARFTSPGLGFYGSLWHIGSLLLLSMGGISMLVHHRAKHVIAQQDPSAKVRRIADKVALQKLAESKKHLDAQDDKNYYESLSRTLKAYIEDKLSIATGSLNKSELSAALINQGVQSETAGRMDALLRESEMALYAGSRSERMTEMYDEALLIVSEIEETLAG